ncbi:MAG TPA: hypothetical protein VN633_00080 [Bryobacteraceae bacterium]|nr:hypothetical protein [Bryobacteraceae bacterium]
MRIIGTGWQISKSSTAADQNALKRPTPDSELQHDLGVTRTIVVAGFLLGLLALLLCSWKKILIDGYSIFFWALACYASGSLAGFLFGIPRVLQGQPTNSKASLVPETRANFSAAYQLLINTNLDDISDWLTKIVVGIGLVELRKLPELLYNLAAVIAGDKGKADIPFILAVILYFCVIGFMSGYLTTRMFFQRAFRASDLAAGGVTEAGAIVSDAFVAAAETRLALPKSTGA